MVQQILSTNTFTTAKWIVSALASDGTHTTIQAAINAASSGDTIFIRPGSYTENPILKSGVDLVAYVTDADVPNVIISGTCTFSGAGTVGISGIELQTNSAFALTVSGSAASVVYLVDSFINCLNNTGISFTSSSGSSAINIINCSANLATTGIALFSSSASGTLYTEYCICNNTGGSTTANTISAGLWNCFYSDIANPTTISGTCTLSAYNSIFSAPNATAITLTATSAPGSLHKSTVIGGSASAISIGAGATLIVDFLEVSSSNTNALTGSGALSYGVIFYNGTSTGNNVTTQTAIATQGGLLFLPGSSLTQNGVLYSGSTRGLISGTAAGTTGQVLTANTGAAPTWGTVSSGAVVQQTRGSTTSNTSGTTSFTLGSTPTTSGGTQILTASITPTNSAHILVIEYQYFMGLLLTTGAGDTGGVISALFNGGTNAIYSQVDLQAYEATASTPVYCTNVSGKYYVAAGGTSAITFSVRMGLYGSVNDWYFLETPAGSTLNGTQFGSITITEYTS